MSAGQGGFLCYASSTCHNHLKSCLNQLLYVRQRAQEETASLKKTDMWYSPYETTWLGAASAPGTFPSGSGSFQMLPLLLLPSTRFSSPALSIHSVLPSPSISALPSPSASMQPSPLLSALPSPSIGTSHLPHKNHLSVQPDQSQTLRLTQLSNGQSWSPESQDEFKNQIAQLTAAAGLPLSWVDNPEWIDFVHQFLPWATSPSWKVLSARLIPRTVENYRKAARESLKGQNATVQADGWTAVNFHHLLAFMITINKKVKFTCCCLADSYELPPQIYTVNVHDASGECKTAENLKLHLEKAIKMVQNAYMAHVVGVVTDASGECWKARRLLSLEYPDIVFLDCYAHQVSFFVFVCPHTNHVVQINLMVGDYFKLKAGVLEFADQASELITWLRSKTLILALLREVQQALPGIENVKAIICAVLTWWTMHYQAFRRLRELRTVITMVVEADEMRPPKERNVIIGDMRAKAKATEMVKLIRKPEFWDALSVYVTIQFYCDWLSNHPTVAY